MGACTKSMSVDADSTMSSVPTALGGCAACGYCCIALPQFVFMIMFWVERGNVNVIECQDNESYKEMNAVFWHSVILLLLTALLVQYSVGFEETTRSTHGRDKAMTDAYRRRCLVADDE